MDSSNNVVRKFKLLEELEKSEKEFAKKKF